MPSFDAVSEIDKHELQNAIDQVNREVSTRFDFRGTEARIEESQGELTLIAESDFQLQQIRAILDIKIAKRGLDIGCLEAKEPEILGKRARQSVQVRQGIDKETARKIIKIVKESKLKVQAAIQGEQVRISGNKRDDLQQVIALLKEAELSLPLQYINFRD
ncbi:nucleotide-binding protein [Candidatus Nitrosoglobus terrae]|uniref:Nucleotide-binding protein TAO_0837 n=1 Tax=Candidatus Nitrosoglobus terrae TaxID=1630141 RepID=A0A1Q2SM70_9GAMM|nr:YajQ family cyclic di-GMP-binding protein [Candidatus Nitrosoglobus terrae]BAW80207.1 nucleotide-binding protein [Candidatus Nitrosoglobus terrae]